MDAVKQFLLNVKQSFQAIGITETEWIDLTNVSSEHANKYFFVFGNTFINRTGLKELNVNVKLTFTFVVKKNDFWEKYQSIISTFYNPSLNANTKIYAVNVNEVTTGEKVFYSKGVEIITVVVQIASVMEG